MEFFKGALRIALAIVFAIVALSVLGGIAAYGYEQYKKSAARPYEPVRQQSFDATDPLGLKLTVKTKLVDDKVYVDLLFLGNPPYLQYPTNSAPDAKRWIAIHFTDKDGFKVYGKEIELRQFTRLHNKGEVAGLAFEFSEFMDVGEYARFEGVNLTWNIDLSEPKTKFIDPDSDPLGFEPDLADHCAPQVGRAERLKRLARHGKVRETGLNEYGAGNRRITFLGGGSELLNCR